jgi:hypothetical protein
MCFAVPFLDEGSCFLYSVNGGGPYGESILITSRLDIAVVWDLWSGFLRRGLLARPIGEFHSSYVRVRVCRQKWDWDCGALGN